VQVNFARQCGQPLPVPEQPPFHEWRFEDDSLYLQFFRLPGAYLLRFPGFAHYQVSADGQHVLAWPDPQVQDATLEHLYLNQVLPLALSRQGRLVLHGSAVDIDGQAVAFLGASGRGKSTLAASFAADGVHFLTDDGLLLEPSGGQLMVMPSHPSIRLWEDSEAALVGAGTERAPAVVYTDKSRLLAGPGMAFCAEARPLNRVYFLGDGEATAPEISPMRSAEALMGFVQNSFLLDFESHAMLTRHFDDLARLTGSTLFFKLDYPRDFAALPAVRQAVVEHLRTPLPNHAHASV
jgi:hypothetical protein